MWLLYLVIIGFLGALVSLTLQYKMGANKQEAQPESTFANRDPARMDSTTARDVLGIDSDARKRDVLMAHRRLIRHMHPDRGGSAYLAMQINQAKDTLLRENHK